MQPGQCCMLHLLHASWILWLRKKMVNLDEAKRALLAEWEAKRDELNTLIAALRRELGMASGDQLRVETPPPSPLSTSSNAINIPDLVRPGDLFGMTQVEGIQTFLQRTNKQSATLQEIAQALYRGKATDTLLDGDKLRNLSSILSKTEVFFPVARGRWGLAEWYPTKSRVRKKGNGGELANEKPAPRAPEPALGLGKDEKS
jgi:hypothetical protein